MLAQDFVKRSFLDFYHAKKLSGERSYLIHPLRTFDSALHSNQRIHEKPQRESRETFTVLVSSS